jgi:hypothetical protein
LLAFAPLHSRPAMEKEINNPPPHTAEPQVILLI